MTNQKKSGLTSNQKKEVIPIIKKICKKNKILIPEVYIFGSRATNKQRDSSDLDLLFVSAEELPYSLFEELRSEFEESHLPFRVDLVSSVALSPEYKEQVTQEKIRLL